VTAVANAVWSRLSGAFSKDIMHGQVRGAACQNIAAHVGVRSDRTHAAPCVVQHLSVFTAILAAPKGKAKRQLDCGGVVTTILAACTRLAAAHGHADLADCRFQARTSADIVRNAILGWPQGFHPQPPQGASHLVVDGSKRVRGLMSPTGSLKLLDAEQVSEDHCWLSLNGTGGREASAELTTTNVAKRGAAVDEAVCGRRHFAPATICQFLGSGPLQFLHKSWHTSDPGCPDARLTA